MRPYQRTTISGRMSGLTLRGSDFPLNNNRNQNNRRRGRGNRNQGGGGNQANRIDSRARGNAPQLLDKYKKLAEDAQRNGDRVQAEYYLQFADHYFRVIADNRARQDEQRGGSGEQRTGRRDERDRTISTETTRTMASAPRYSRDRAIATPRSRHASLVTIASRDNREPREPRRERASAATRWRGQPSATRSQPRRGAGSRLAVEASEGPAFEPEDNPFTRDTRDEQDRSPSAVPRAPARDERQGEAHGIDAAALPPSLSANDAATTPMRAEEAPPPAPPQARRRWHAERGRLSATPTHGLHRARDRLNRRARCTIFSPSSIATRGSPRSFAACSPRPASRRWRSWPLALRGIAGLAWLVWRSATGAKQAALLGWLFGVAHFTLANNWIATAFTFQAEMPAALGWAAVPLLSLYLAVFPGDRGCALAKSAGAAAPRSLPSRRCWARAGSSANGCGAGSSPATHGRRCR